MTVELTPQLESALLSEATRRGTTPDLLAVELIESQLSVLGTKLPNNSSDNPQTAAEPAQGAPAETQQTLYDWLKPHFDSLPEPPPDAPQTNYSHNTGRRFAEAMVQKMREGRL
jgi:hypothetical protein